MSINLYSLPLAGIPYQLSYTFLYSTPQEKPSEAPLQIFEYFKEFWVLPVRLRKMKDFENFN